MVAEKGKSELSKVDFGTCVWTTGIKMAPITHRLIEQLPSGLGLLIETLVVECMHHVSVPQCCRTSKYMLGNAVCL